MMFESCVILKETSKINLINIFMSLILVSIFAFSSSLVLGMGDSGVTCMLICLLQVFVNTKRFICCYQP
jgi:hypothetical protein